MARAKIFIDGEHGTTGLQILQRLEGRADIELVSPDPARRKDPAARKAAMAAADFAILCLPDDAAREAVSLAEGTGVRIIDASTAHRTAPGWVYGFPEMTPEQAGLIKSAARVTNPGCYPTGAIALLRPVIAGGLVPADWPVTINAVSGYSGGGKAMIAAYEDPASADATQSPFRLYALNFEHKHIPEMQAYAGLAHRPLFVPSVGRFAQGMLVSVPLPLWALPGTPSGADLRACLAAAYAAGGTVEVASAEECGRIAAAGSLSPDMPQPEVLNGTNKLRLFVFANEGRGEALLLAQLDNLGKGASGQAVQCLDLMMG